MMGQVNEFTGQLVTPVGAAPARVTVDGGVITSITEDPAAWEPGGLILVPGFVDLHNHGGQRGSFPDGSADDCRRAAEYHRRNGTTTMLASLVSATEQAMTAQVPVLADLVDEGLLAGIHLEGPFINTGRCGAQDPAAIIPGDPDMLDRVATAARGHVRAVTFAPETAHAHELLDVCAAHDIIASLGHTDAGYDKTLELVDAAVEKNVTVTATHLFNAMPPLHHRAPGAAAAMITAAATSRAHVELIADGVHLADGTVDMVRDSVADGAFFVTDAMQAAGMPDGDYTLGTLDVTVADGVARLSEPTGAIAGGTTTLADQFARHLRRGVPRTDLVRATSTTAAAILGRGGTIEEGARADLVGLDENGQVMLVVASGEIITDNRQ